MKCEKCGKNEATMYYKETVNGVTREMHLCPECAKKENLGGAFESAFQSMNHFWSDPFHSFLGGGFGSRGTMCWAKRSDRYPARHRAQVPDLRHDRERAAAHRPRRLPGLLLHVRGYSESVCPEDPRCDAPYRHRTGGRPNSPRPIRSLTSRLS